MVRPMRALFLLGTIAAGMLGLGSSQGDEPLKPVTDPTRPSIDEARERAKLLHATFEDTLQIVHSRFYREDEGLPIPAATLKEVFQRLAERDNITLRWLVVDAKPMNVEHNPRDEFEKQAVDALISGKEEYERAGDGVYRHVGRITLGSDCLKCHLPSRTSNKSRAAGLVISMPVAKE